MKFLVFEMLYFDIIKKYLIWNFFIFICFSFVNMRGLFDSFVNKFVDEREYFEFVKEYYFLWV